MIIPPGFRWILPLGVLLVTLVGCRSSQNPSSSLYDRLDAMEAQNEALRAEAEALRDSLQFYDDIDSGQYYRDMRRLSNQIDKLTFELQASREGGQTVAVLLADDLFAPASASLTERGIASLNEVAAQLDSTYAGQMVRIEGHSDGLPIRPGSPLAERYPTNWELSAARAASVARHLMDAHGIDAAQIEVVSFGPARPIATNETAQGRLQNRRVRIAVLPEADEPDDVP